MCIEQLGGLYFYLRCSYGLTSNNTHKERKANPQRPLNDLAGVFSAQHLVNCKNYLGAWQLLIMHTHAHRVGVYVAKTQWTTCSRLLLDERTVLQDFAFFKTKNHHLPLIVKRLQTKKPQKLTTVTL